MIWIVLLILTVCLVLPSSSEERVVVACVWIIALVGWGFKSMGG